MTLTLEVPDDLAARLEASWRDLSGGTLEALAVEAYVRGDLSSEEVGRLIGITPGETDALLGQGPMNPLGSVTAAVGPKKRGLTPAQRRALALIREGLDFGGSPYPRREDLYDREVTRRG